MSGLDVELNPTCSQAENAMSITVPSPVVMQHSQPNLSNRGSVYEQASVTIAGRQDLLLVIFTDYPTRPLRGTRIGPLHLPLGTLFPRSPACPCVCSQPAGVRKTALTDSR